MDLEETIKLVEKGLERLKELAFFSDAANTEIIMWRRRYLDSLPRMKGEREQTLVDVAFLYVPAEEMIKDSPEVVFKNIVESKNSIPEFKNEA